MKKILINLLNKIGILSTLRFLRKFIWLKTTLGHIDGNSPFRGKLSENGIYITNLSSKDTEYLLNKSESSDNKNNLITLNFEDKEVLANIFNLLTPIVKDYIGGGALIDGINWKLNVPNEKEVFSQNWHSDGVGSRIKCFICVKGDGSMPTLVLPSKKRIPSIFYLFQSFISESVREKGLKNINNVKGSIEAKHKSGSVILFDTQLLHRGGYDKAESERLIFHMEFTNPKKHKILNNHFLGTQVGTFDNYNSFYFDNRLLSIESFRDILDPQRIISKEKYLCKYSSNKNRNA
jgi:hypothetical protein